MKQFDIRKILERNQIIPVVTFADLSEIDGVIDKLQTQKISCIEVTLRTPVAMESLRILKRDYSEVLDVGVGTVTELDQLNKVRDLEVDFIVSPGLMSHLAEPLQTAGIPFIPGVVTPSEIIEGISLGYDTFKFFPAELFGGIDVLKAYASVFPQIKFCPTGGVNADNHARYLALENVISVGGSWVV